MANTRRCACFCHAHKRADLADAKQRLLRTVGDDALCAVLVEIRYWNSDESINHPPNVSFDDQLETLVAIGCRCLMDHAFLPMPRPKFLPPQQWKPSDDGD